MSQTTLADIGRVSDTTRQHWEEAGRIAQAMVDAETASDPIVEGVVQCAQNPNADYKATIAITGPKGASLRPCKWHEKHGYTVTIQEVVPTQSLDGSDTPELTVHAVVEDSDGLIYELTVEYTTTENQDVLRSDDTVDKRAGTSSRRQATRSETMDLGMFER